jgi:class 3 adenylate cyclase
LKNCILALLIIFAAPSLWAQDAKTDSLSRLIVQAKPDTAKVKLILELGNHIRKTDLKRAIELGKEAFALSEKLGYYSGSANSSNLIGLCNYFLNNYPEALIHWQTAKEKFEMANDTSGVANVLSNMGAIYHNQSEYSKAIELYVQALKLAEASRDTMRIGTVLQNIGAVHLEKGSHSLALEAYQKVLLLFEAIGYKEGIGLAHLNSGEAYKGLGNMPQAIVEVEKAMPYLKNTSYLIAAYRTLGEFKLIVSNHEDGMQYLDTAYQLGLESGDEFELTRIVNAIAKAYEEKGDLNKALVWFERAKALMATTDRSNMELKLSAEGLVRIYAGRQDYKRAYENFEILYEVSNNIYNLESDQKIDHLLFGFEMEKKESEIALLVKDKEIQTLEMKRQKGIRNGFVAGFIMVLLFAATFFVQRNQIKKGKKRSDELLLNILPEEIAEELKETGRADARDFDKATILFTDFKGFTQLSAKLGARELVAEINTCFEAFDRIMEKYDIEKIKTIGDAYMAAGGLPVPTEQSVKNTVLAALDMQDFISQRIKKQMAAAMPYFEMRLGIHTGPVIAGIVGFKKFQYDIWGDTVNTAARMESSGEVGKVNISRSTYDFLKNDPDFTFEKRGKIEAKGKGVLKMYFVSRVE